MKKHHRLALLEAAVAQTQSRVEALALSLAQAEQRIETLAQLTTGALERAAVERREFEQRVARVVGAQSKLIDALAKQLKIETKGGMNDGQDITIAQPAQTGATNEATCAARFPDTYERQPEHDEAASREPRAHREDPPVR